MASIRPAQILATLISLSLILVPDVAVASHFRYATITWKPTGLTRAHVNDVSLTEEQVEFTLRAAYRRSYQWGASEGITWAQTSTASQDKVYYGSESLYKQLPGYDTSLENCTLQAQNEVLLQNACFNCPDGSVTGYEGCEMIDPQFDLASGDSSGNGVAGEKFYIRLPPKMQSDGVTEVVPCPAPFHCDIREARTEDTTKQTVFTAQDNSATAALCSQYMNNPDKDADKCAPWAETYGMFMGDGSAQTIELEVTHVDYSDNSIVGDYLTGVSTFTHYYLRETEDPFVAFFTGGDRAYECNYPDTPLDADGTCSGDLNYRLNNNAEGRFRLETEVWLQGDGNRPPVLQQLPVLPVPHHLPGVRAKFQIPAIDPDGDELTFRFGNYHEMGGIVRSKTDAFPYSENLALNGPAKNSYEADGSLKLIYGTQYGRFGCDESSKAYENTGRCPIDREPQFVPGIDQSFTSTAVPGLIEWNTWYESGSDPTTSPCPSADGTGCTKLQQGLYNMIVMVSDSQVKVPVDFMVYLYDGPFHFCDKACADNKMSTPELTTGVADNPATDNYVDGVGYTPKYPGLQTFADMDGVYGAEVVHQSGLTQSQSCTVCGIGSGNSTSSLCTPVSADGQCGILSQGSIVPNPEAACRTNNPPEFISAGVINDIMDTPGLEQYEASLALTSNARPAIVKNYGNTFDFYVTAIDTDDCTELALEAVSLPVGAEFGEYEYLSDYAEFPQGMKVRRRFTWTWDNEEGLSVDQDPRPESSLVCFYASDKYLVTSQPYYCVELKLEAEIPMVEETLLRFDCKLELNWQPNLKRFVVADGDSKYYTACSFEDYMWHHAMVSIGEDGVGRLYIDGEAQELEINVGVDTNDKDSYDTGTSIGTSFTALQYPNKCEAEESRRRLASFTDTDGYEIEQTDGTYSYNAEPLGSVVTDSSLDAVGSGCCSFKMGEGCSDNSTLFFDGLIDEVAVWNRQLSAEEVASTLFHMPKHMLPKSLEAPRGNQVDFAAGRALYARFNNPCVERTTPAPAPPPSPAPAASPAMGGRKLQQIADQAGYSAYVDGTLQDLDDDSITFLSDTFGVNTKYVYTGVPWQAPFVTHSSVDNVEVPLDGGTVATVYGVGFAKSPFTKCILGTPLQTAAASGVYDYGYNRSSSVAVEDGDALDTFTMSVAEVKHTANEALPFLVVESYRHPANKVYLGSDNLRSDWYVDPSAENGGVLREGNIPPFEQITDHSILTESIYRDFEYGFYEAVTCEMPQGTHPAETYYLGVSNDGAVSSSPKHENITYAEYGLRTQSDTSVALSTAAQGKTFSLWFYPIYQNDATLLLLTNNLAVVWQNRVLQIKDSFTVLFTSMELSIKEWHNVILVVDGGVVIAYVDGNFISSAVIASISGFQYQIESFANGFEGVIDELKVLTEAITAEQVHSIMFTRDAGADGRYVRFNSNNEGYAVSGLAYLQAQPVPWEPVVIYSITVDGEEVDDGMLHLSMRGGEEITVTGYNMGASPWLSCNFGSSNEYTFSVTHEDITNNTCPTGQGALLRPGSGYFADIQYPISVMFRSNAIKFAEAALQSATSVSTLKCTVPSFDEAMVTEMVVGELTHDVMLADVQESALYCDGASSATNSAALATELATTSLDGVSSPDEYTVALWTLPQKAEGLQTVLTLGPTSGGDPIKILFDGQKFIYHDTSILDAPAATASKLGEWHHVAVTVSSDGNGVLYVDFAVAATFTTTARPFPTQALVLCSDSEDAYHYSGSLDEVTILSAFLDAAQIKTLGAQASQSSAFLTSADAPTHEKYDFNHDDVLTRLSLNGATLASSTGPWYAAYVTGVSPSRVPLIGGTSVTVTGGNFASSPAFDIGMDVVSQSANEIVAGTRSATMTSSLGPLFATNGYHEEAFSDANFAVAATEVDVMEGLEAHYSMDFISNGTTIYTVIDDSGKGNHIPFNAAGYQNDRNGNTASAIKVGPSYLEAAGNFTVEFATAISGPFTLCAWVKIEYPSTVSQVGGWKMYSITGDDVSLQDTYKVYVNDAVASSDDQAHLEAHLTSVFLDGILLEGLDASVDDVWIYSRALTGAEIAYRYKAYDFATDLGAGPVSLLASTSTAFPISTVELWLMPKTIGADQVILSTSAFEVILTSEGSVKVAVGTPCDCEPCDDYFEHTSWKASLTPSQWAHLAIDFDGTALLIFVDGVLLDKATSPSAFALMLDAGIGMTLGASFDGLVYDLYLSSVVKAEHRRSTLCPPKTFVATDVYFRMTSGMLVDYNIAPSNAAYPLTLSMPSASSVVEHLFDDETFLVNTFVYGPGLSGTTSSAHGVFTITSHTACGRKRRFGGDNFQARFKGNDNSVYAIDAEDNGDGNYHVTYTGLQCATYEMALYSGANLVSTYAVAVTPGETSADHSVIIDEESIASPKHITCFGDLAVIQVQAMDAYGCKSTAGTDNWNVILSGTVDALSASSQHLGNGLYEISFVPPAAGQYIAELRLGTATVKTFCMDVCVGGSHIFYGNTAIESLDVEEHDSQGMGMTIEAWIQPALKTENVRSDIIRKSSVEEADNFTKGFELSLSGDYSDVYASFYTGLGDVRDLTVSHDFALGTWAHICATYDGKDVKIYVDGSLIGSRSYDTEATVHYSAYNHALTVGYGFSGLLDEVTVYSFGMAASEVVSTIYCPPFYFSYEDKIVAYFGFNEPVEEGEEGTSEFMGFAYSGGALKEVAAAYVGPTVQQQQHSTETPYTTGSGSDMGVGSFGIETTVLDIPDKAKAGYNTYPIQLKDKCGFNFLGFAPTNLALVLQPYEFVYADVSGADALGVTYPYTSTLSESYASSVIDGSYSSQCPSLVTSHNVTVEFQAAAGRFKLSMLEGVSSASKDDFAIVADMAEDFSVHVPANITAGVASSILFEFKDQYDNVVTDASAIASTLAQVTVDIGADGVYDFIQNENSEGLVSLELYVTSAGQYNMTLGMSWEGKETAHGDPNPQASGSGSVSKTFTIDVADPPMRELVHSSVSLGGGLDVDRFEHTGFSYENALYIWGGATFDKAYRSDMYMLPSLDPFDSTESLAYKRSIRFTPAVSSTLTANVVVEIVVNTAELVNAGRLSPTCKDIAFEHMHGLPLRFFVDPYTGCNADDTKIYVEVPPGTPGVDMYYGNAAFGSNPNHTPAIFAFFEDFSKDTHAFAAVGPCTLDEIEATADSHTFSVVDDAFFSPSVAPGLRLDKGTMYAALGQATIHLPSFKLSSLMYDANYADASHFLSIDKGYDPDTVSRCSLDFVGVGIYSLSHGGKYCTEGPWQASSEERSAGARLIEIVGTTTDTQVFIDGVLVKTYDRPDQLIDRIVLSSSLGSDGTAHASLEASFTVFDEIYVMAYDPQAAVASSGSMSTDALVSYVEGRHWTKVEPAGHTPPPRYSHAGALVADTFYVSGGERSGYAFGDLWSYDIKAASWSFVLTHGIAPLARYDHTLTTMGSSLVMAGGRNAAGEVFSDLWLFDVATKVWSSIGSLPRGSFGHAAAYCSTTNKLFVLGGYNYEDGFLGSLSACTVSMNADTYGVGPAASCIDVTTGCAGVEGSVSLQAVGFEPRHQHAMVAFEGHLYVYGGSEGDGPAAPRLFKYDPVACVASVSPLAEAVGVYEGIVGAMASGAFVHGGFKGPEGNYELGAYPVYAIPL